MPGDSRFTRITNLTPAVLRLTAAGCGVVLAAGVGYVEVKTEKISDTAGVVVDVPAPPSEWDLVLSDTLVIGDVVVPDGERWLIGANVRVQGNVRTRSGTIALRPGSSLTFVGADPAKYVGGGMHFVEGTHNNDFGIWVGPGSGRLDVSCTPKASWNRTGVDPTWAPTDEYWIAPTAAGDYKPRRWYPGQPIPRADLRVPAAEVANVTRDCVIEGPGHIHIHSQAPQRIEYVRLEKMGVTLPGKETIDDSRITGRYALHLHMMGDGARGTVIRGVAITNAGNHSFVPHASHGITMEDNVSLLARGAGLWWDPGRDIGHDTHDLSVDRHLVLGWALQRGQINNDFQGAAVLMGTGERNSMTRSVVAGIWFSAPGKQTQGFFWPDFTRFRGKWEFRDNVVHNVSGHGVKHWVNDGLHHEQHGTIAYRNRKGDVDHGKYKDVGRYFGTMIIDGWLSIRSAPGKSRTDGRSQRFENLTVVRKDGPAVRIIDQLQRYPNLPVVFEKCRLEVGTGHPKVWISNRANFPWWAEFRNCNLTPADIQIDFPLQIAKGRDGLNGTVILLDDGPGRRWEIRVENGRRIDRQLP